MSLLHALLHLPAGVVLPVVGALVFGEAALFVGFVLPGETAVLLGGFLASTGRLSLALLAAVVVACAIAGDSVGYEVGRRFGPRMLGWRLFRRHRGRVANARAFLDGRGGSAVLVGRFTAFLRAVTPGLAGLSGMRYRRFLAWNALGGLLWGVGCVVAGYLAGSSYEKVASYVGRAGAVAALAMVVVALVAWRARRRHAREAEPPDVPEPCAEDDKAHA
ncbi:MAG: DedA family protein [Nocardioidaceae bacterium]|nr:DedA family protein [Nocardioidaceae bacterium]